MRNIFIVPIDQPSRLWINSITGKLVLDEEPNTLHSQHVYITSDEEIKEGDWFIHTSHNITSLNQAKSVVPESIITANEEGCWMIHCKKIILTTDPTLIADGIQGIDNTFLEWFVKNPTREFVKVDVVNDSEDHPELVGSPREEWTYYEIKIPIKCDCTHFCRKGTLDDEIMYCDQYEEIEEPKKYPIGGFAPGDYWHNECVTCNDTFTGDKRAVQCEPCAIEMVNIKVKVNEKGGIEIVKQDELEEAKKETLKVAAINYSSYNEQINKAVQEAVIFGADWQSKRMYSESELRELIIKALTHDDDKICGSLVTKEKEIRTANFGVWFEENKKR